MDHGPKINCFAASHAMLVANAALMVGLSLALPHTRAEQAVDNSDAQQRGIEYRRVFVPADEPASWPLVGERFLPIESREFHQLLAAANDRRWHQRQGAILTAATYIGRMQYDGNITGHGRWEIELQGDGPTLMRLGDPSLIVRNAHWRDTPQQLLRLGRWGTHSGAARDVDIEIARSGVVEFDWQAPTASQASDAAPAWRLPQALTSRLSISMPQEFRPVVTGGVILRSATISNEVEADTPSLRWEIAAGAAPSTLQIISAAATVAEVTPDVTYREEVTYNLHERGLDVQSTYLFDDTSSPLHELVIPLPPGVQFMSAEANGRELEWRVAAREHDSTAVFLPLPHISGQGPRAVTLRAWQTPVLGRPWLLPRIRPNNMFWTSGEMEFSIASPLALLQLTPIDCIQAGVARLPDSQAGPETSWFTLYSPAAGLEITVAQREVRAVVEQVSSLSVVESVVSGRQASRLAVRDGAVHTLTGELSAGWVLASIESIPANALGDWFLTKDENRNDITIQLAQPATADRPVTVVVNAQWQQPDIGQPLPTELFRLVRWQGLPTARHYATIQVPEPNSAEPTGGLREVLPATMPAEIRPLLESVGSPVRVFDLTHTPPAESFQLTAKRAEFEVESELNAVLEDESIRQSYALHVRFRSHRPDRLLVFADDSLGDAAHWSDGVTGRPLDAERIPAGDPRRAGSPLHGELWQVRVPQTNGDAVDIRASVVAPLAQRQQLPLLAVLDATQQSCRVVLYGSQLDGPQVEQVNLLPMPPPLLAPAADVERSKQHALAAYRYNPVDCLKADGGPRLWIRTERFQRPTPLIARQATLSTFILPDKGAVHRAEFQLASGRRGQGQLRLPEGAQDVSIAVNSYVIGISDDRQPTEPIVIPLPGGDQTTQLSVEFSTRNAPLSIGSVVEPPLFDEIRVVTGEWNIWLPQDYALVRDDMSPLSTGFSPLRRLLGPFVPQQRSAGIPWIEVAGANGTGAGDGQLLVAGGSDESMIDRQVGRVLDNGDRTATDAAIGPQLQGWRMYRAPLVANSAPALTIVQPASTRAWGIAAFLLCVAVGQPLARYFRSRYVWVIASAAVTALALSAAYAPIATGALIGFVVSLVVAWPPGQLSEESPTRTWTGPMVRATISLMATGIYASRADGQPAGIELPAATAAAEQATQQVRLSANGPMPRVGIERVLIPTDSQGRTVGTKCYVSEQLLRELYRLAQADTMSHQAWLLLDARCDGELIDSKTPSGIVAGDWTLTLSVDAVARDTTIVLPLVYDEANWAPHATLDGLPTAIAWRHDGLGCEITIAEPGRYDVEIGFVPHVAPARGQEQIMLTVPPILGGLFRLRFPPERAPDKVTGTLPTSAEGVPGTLSRYLDGSGRLTVGWPHLQPAQGDSQNVRVSELQWLQIAESGVWLTAKFIVEGGTQRPESLHVAYDAPWELDSAGELTAESLSGDGGRRNLRVTVPPDDANRQEFVVRWRLPNTMPPGQIKLPAIGLQSPPATIRWFGASIPPSLQSELLDGTTATNGTAAEFLARWADGPLADELSLVSARLDPLHSVSIAVKPRISSPTVSESLNVVAARDGLRVRYQADITTHGVGHYRFPLEIGEQLEVDQVTVESNGLDVPLRWTRAGRTSVGMFLSQRIADDYRLTLQAHVPPNSTSTYTLPRVAAPGPHQQSVQFFRTDDALLEIVGLSPADNAAGLAIESPNPVDDVHLVAARSLTTDAESDVQLVVTPNVVQAEGPTATILRRDADAWWVEFACRLTVAQGELGSLRLRAPRDWIGPLEVQSSVPAAAEQETAAPSGSTVVVRMAKPVTPGQKLEVRVRGRLSVDAATMVAVPQIVPETPISGPRFLVAPRTVEALPVLWTELGVHASVLPAEFVRPDDDPATWKCWEAETADFRVALIPSTKSRSTPRVRLADTWAAIDLDGRQIVVSALLLISPDATELDLLIPPGQELVGLTANGGPMLARRLDDHRWQLAAGTAILPQWIEVVTCSNSRWKPPSARVEVARPRLWHGSKPVPVELSLWSMCLPTATSGANVGLAGEASALEQAVLRIDRLAGISEAATPAALDLAKSSGRDWYVPWAACLKQVQEQSLAIIGSTRAASTTLHVAASPDVQLERALERLGAWRKQADEDFAVGGQLQQATVKLAAVDLVDRFRNRADNWLFRVADGDVPSMPVDLSDSVLPPRQIQLGSLLLVIGAALSVFVLGRRATNRDALYRWPHAVLLMIGLAWWLWLWPSWVGLVLAGGSVWLKFRAGWPGRLVRSEGSTVVRAGKPL